MCVCVRECIYSRTIFITAGTRAAPVDGVLPPMPLYLGGHMWLVLVWRIAQEGLSIHLLYIYMSTGMLNLCHIAVL